MIGRSWIWALFAFGMIGIMSTARVIGDAVSSRAFPADAENYLAHYGPREWFLVGWAFLAAMIILIVYVKLQNSSRKTGEAHGSR